MLRQLLFRPSKATIDAVVTVLIVGTCAYLVWDVYSRSIPKVVAETPVPKQPLSLDNAPALGSRSARVGLVLFSDFQCPFCRRFATEIIPELRREYIEPGHVLLAFRHFPLSSLHKDAERLAASAACAQQHGKFWEMHDAIFLKPKEVTHENVLEYAEGIGIEPGTLDSCVQTTGLAQVRAEVELATNLQFKSTPILAVGTLNANNEVMVRQLFKGIRPVDIYRKVINEMLGSETASARASN